MNKIKILDALRAIKRIVNRTLVAVDQKLIPVFALNGFFASVYYTFINPAFYREHLSVLRGRREYHASQKNIERSSVLLRRNTHRLEKGLIMQPRREIFAKAYIGETIDCYLRCNENGSVCKDEMKWAGDVITEYFSVVGDTDRVINQQREKFSETTSAATDYRFKPYLHLELPQPPVDYQGLLTLCKRRRSVRWYQSRAVPNELISKAVSAASLAPSACNRQPYRFVFFDKSADVSSVASLAMGTAGFSHQFPCLFAVVGDLSCYPKERDRHIIYIDASLASMQLMLALETLGLSSCPINWPDIEMRERKMAKKLKLNKHERVIMLIATGYADPQGGIAYSQKKGIDNLLEQQQVAEISG